MSEELNHVKAATSVEALLNTTVAELCYRAAKDNATLSALGFTLPIGERVVLAIGLGPDAEHLLALVRDNPPPDFEGAPVVYQGKLPRTEAERE